MVTPLIVVMTEAPVPCDKVTVWPATGVPEPSSKVTVMVEVAVPLSRTEVGLATTVDVVALTGPWKVTPAVSVTTRPDWVTSVAV